MNIIDSTDDFDSFFEKERGKSYWGTVDGGVSMSGERESLNIIPKTHPTNIKVFSTFRSHTKEVALALFQFPNHLVIR
jgi:hypothetical protein